jgi:predicted nucleotidyltransferase
VAAICRRFHVRRLEVFGSAAAGEFDPARSDIDFLVEFEPKAPGSALGTYLGLKDALEAFRNILVHGYAVVEHEIAWRDARGSSEPSPRFGRVAEITSKRPRRRPAPG